MAKPKVNRTPLKPRTQPATQPAARSANRSAVRKSAANGPDVAVLAPASADAGPIAPGNQAGFDLAEKIKELVRLAHEQGYLTYGDITEALIFSDRKSTRLN